MKPGPLKKFVDAVCRIQSKFPERECPIRTSLVTARNAPAQRRPIYTLRTWGIRVDDTVFLGGIEKARIFQVLKPHIYFDDQREHLAPAAPSTPVAEVPR